MAAAELLNWYRLPTDPKHKHAQDTVDKEKPHSPCILARKIANEKAQVRVGGPFSA